MQSLQLRGPFAAGHTETVELNTVYEILKIGVEHPHSIPIGRYYLNNEGNIVTHVKIDDNVYAIADNDILEFDGLYQSKITIQFLQAVDHKTIVDLVFVDNDDTN